MQTKIFAHRGASKYAPENTMPAFELALKLGADGIETDVQLTKDNVPVLIHDESVRRTSNGKGFVKDITFKQLTTLDMGSWFSNKFMGTKIVSLEHFLDWIQDKPLDLNIELKNNKIDYQGLEKIVLDLLDKYQLLNRTTLSTFNPKSVTRVHDLTKEVDIAFLTSKRIKYFTNYVKELGASSIHIKYRLLSSSLMEDSKQQQLQVRVYTVNKPAHLIRCFNQKCDAVFTDVPDIAKDYRRLFT
ncbi:glycerophosphodiester phosphodiesterase [Oceanobacillus manasiensis]|uniref:glycerophosphodiester phosphodiesterase n=1 Tax=Oceanobacillus manasiensis TaxID=586413 RepID=UPI0005AAF442|nr:glycerophosphodiester phosphodiesterase [Oceanobacillus manasiensis]